MFPPQVAGSFGGRMDTGREVPGFPSLRKACGVVVRDALFLSLLNDPYNRRMAEERMCEVL